MSNPELFSSPEYELSSLRSELAEVFEAHTRTVAYYQPDDFNEPVEFVLGGKCTVLGEDGDELEIFVHLRQRLSGNGSDYLIIARKDDIGYWYQVNDNSATEIYDGSEMQLTTYGAAGLRRLIRADNTTWTHELTVTCAECVGLYEQARSYAGNQLAE